MISAMRGSSSRTSRFIKKIGGHMSFYGTIDTNALDFPVRFIERHFY